MPTEEQTYRQGVLEKLDILSGQIKVVDEKVSYTNGKVRKIILVLVLIFGILIGQVFTNTHDIISLLVALF